MGKPLVACIVETRKEVNLIKVINDHMKFLPKGTDLFIYHGRSARFLKTIFPDAKLIEIVGDFNERNYNELLTSTKFWSPFLNYNQVMIFQSDGGILREGIEEFCEYDYYGSPWTFQIHGGNGGESLRNPKIMYEICSKYSWDGINEDVWFCNIMHDYKLGKLAPREVCERWGAEGIFKTGTFCYHAIHAWLSTEECEIIKNQYGNNKS